MNEGINIIEAVIAAGDLSRLSVDQRNTYYVTVCQSIGLNPLTRPFEYITLNGKLTLYARKDATDQLRSIKGVSITRADVSLADPDWVIVTTEARDATGRTDIDVGCVSRKDMRGDLGNVIMKAVTKSKRRVTLSLCGLGMLDESEVETIPDAKPFVAPTPQIPVAPDWKAELIALGKQAAATVDEHDSYELQPGMAEWMDELKEAMQCARTVLIANGRSTPAERVEAINALKKALNPVPQA